MDWATVVGDALLGGTSMGGAYIAARASRFAREARNVGEANAEHLAVVRKQTNGQQRQMIKDAVQEVAAEHRELVTEAVSDELVRTVLEAILSGHVDEWHPRRRKE